MPPRRAKENKPNESNFRVAVMVVETGSSPATDWVFSIQHKEMYFPACRSLEEAEERSEQLVKMYAKRFHAGRDNLT